MAIPYTPQNLTAQQANGNILLSWQGSLGATSYSLQRSTDGVNFTNLATTNAIQYTDSYPGIGIQYFYQVAAVNTDGTSPYSLIATMIAAPPGEMSLYELRLRARECADRVDSPFIKESELSSFARIAQAELYDILVTSYEDYFSLKSVTINTNGTTSLYELPDGATNYLGGVYGGVSGAPAPAFYKATGVDLNVNTSSITPSRVSLLKFDFIKRNEYVYPNSTSTIYGVYNMRYRVMGDDSGKQFLDIIPTPSGNQTLTLWYTPLVKGLLADTDITTVGKSGWLRYVIVRTAKYMLDKEEGADTSKLDAEILFLKKRIEEASQNKDAGIPDTISETRIDPIYGGTGFGGGTSGGGW